jgi:hypothetical protein
MNVLRRIGYALLLTLAIGAGGASGAQAQSYWFNSDGSPTTLSGTQTIENGDSLAFDAGTVRCKKITYSGAMTGTTATQITVTPSFSECQVSGLQATIDMNGCDYVLTAVFSIGNVDVFETTLICPTVEKVTQEMKLTISLLGTVKCTIGIPEQTLDYLVGSVGTNGTAGGVKDITADLQSHVITYSQKPGTGIGTCATATDTSNGSYSGQATFQGQNSGGGATSIWLE